MTLSLYQLPPFIFNLLPYIGAGALATFAYTLGGWLLPRLDRSRVMRVELFADTKSARRDMPGGRAPVGSFAHQVRIAFARFGIDASGREEYILRLAQIVVGAGMTLLLMVIGLPFLTSLVGFLAGYVFVKGWIVRVWNKTRTEMEAEIPSLLMRLNATVQAAPNVPSALETVAKTLKGDGPLREWTMQIAARMHNEGHAAIEVIREDAASISTSLAISAELIGRIWTTGGEGYARAFGAASDNLESVLEARVLARAKGGSAQGTVNILMVMTFGMIAFMTRSAALGDVVQHPLVQLLYGIIAVVIVYGHSQIGNMIDNAV